MEYGCFLLCHTPFCKYVLVSNPKIIQIRLIFILFRQAGIYEIAPFTIPFFQSAVIEHLQIIFNDKRNHIVFQAFFISFLSSKLI